MLWSFLTGKLYPAVRRRKSKAELRHRRLSSRLVEDIIPKTPEAQSRHTALRISESAPPGLSARDAAQPFFAISCQKNILFWLY
jgi:hypothetical protein